eukprot:CAMPEP_0174955430 /NCGR_PEP_ID=MMETSP0004_2-20121128/976_1 /TAXON_ID=420556 /ORGANISM="Ochromonas sp., Strain CCMP1393" /LENGTH=116 /DNA_ID=CAMNT_0016203355 /DNA_START=222 /DNA_END=572 /DNA_ORIENTATION=-
MISKPEESSEKKVKNDEGVTLAAKVEEVEVPSSGAEEEAVPLSVSEEAGSKPDVVATATPEEGTVSASEETTPLKEDEDSVAYIPESVRSNISENQNKSKKAEPDFFYCLSAFKFW